MWKNWAPKESDEGAHTVLTGSLRAPEGFSKGKPDDAKKGGTFPKVLPRVSLVHISHEERKYGKKRWSLSVEGLSSTGLSHLV